MTAFIILSLQISSMLLSMTGYGRAAKDYKGKKINVEIRSLNSKQTDVRFKIPQNYREKEHLLRKDIINKIKRGKIELIIEVHSDEGGDGYGLDKPLFRKYFRELSELAQELQMPMENTTAAILRIPNVVINQEGTLTDEEWKMVTAALDEAIGHFNHFRASEGEALGKDLKLRVKNITEILEQVAPFEAARVVNLRNRLNQRLEEYKNKEQVDENRFEQEVLYYLEKIDITEEKVRLAQHCKFFLEEMGKSKITKGRKLGFICQELGREINTMGAKAYSHDIQRLVVAMKDELEKMKEQVVNIV